MLNRRKFLIGTAGVALTSLLTGCRGAAKDAFKIMLLEGAIPSEVLQKFEKQAVNPVRFQMAAQIENVFQQLEIWQKATAQKDPKASSFSIRRLLPGAKVETGAKSDTSRPDNLVSLGDYWLESAIAQNLIDPLELSAESLEKLPIAWQSFGSRNKQGLLEGIASEPSPLQPQKISLWAVPYKVQALVIIYRQSLFSENGDDQAPFASWRDLLQPQFRQSIALPNHPRLVIGLAQKIQSGSFNAVLEGSNKTSDQTSDKTSDKTLEKTDRQLADTLVKLNLQVKTYDSENSLKALVNEDVKAVVAWSGDALAALKRYRDLRMFIPPEGSLLSADMWVRPKGAEMSTAAQNWIDFCWQSGPATQISVSEKGISPIFLKGDRALPETLAGGLFSTEVLQNSEPLLPIPAVLKTAYLDLWEQTRSAQI